MIARLCSPLFRNNYSQLRSPSSLSSLSSGKASALFRNKSVLLNSQLRSPSSFLSLSSFCGGASPESSEGELIESSASKSTSEALSLESSERNLIKSSASKSTAVFSENSLRASCPLRKFHIANNLILSPLASGYEFETLYSNLLFKNSYKYSPKLRNPPSVHPDAMDVLNLNDNYTMLLITRTLLHFSQACHAPEDDIMEMKFATCKNSDLSSKAPKFRVHNLCAGFKEKYKVTHVIDPTVEKARADEKREMIELAKQVIADDLADEGINEDELKRIWWNDGGEDILDFWAKRLLKHFQFGPKGDPIMNYASKIIEFGKTVVEGDGNNLSLGDFLELKKFEVGKYYDVVDLHPVLREYFGVEAYPTFIGQGVHPCLFEVGVIRARETGDKLDHPMAKQVPPGKFQIRRI